MEIFSCLRLRAKCSARVRGKRRRGTHVAASVPTKTGEGGPRTAPVGEGYAESLPLHSKGSLPMCLNRRTRGPRQGELAEGQERATWVVPTSRRHPPPHPAGDGVPDGPRAILQYTWKNGRSKPLPYGCSLCRPQGATTLRAADTCRTEGKRRSPVINKTDGRRSKTCITRGDDISIALCYDSAIEKNNSNFSGGMLQ